MKGGDIEVVTNRNNNIKKLCIKDDSGTIDPENCWYLFPKNPTWTDERGQPIDPKKKNLGGIFGSLDSDWKKVISTLDKVAPNRLITKFGNEGFSSMVSPGESTRVSTIDNPNPLYIPEEYDNDDENSPPASPSSLSESQSSLSEFLPPPSPSSSLSESSSSLSFSPPASPSPSSSSFSPPASPSPSSSSFLPPPSPSGRESISLSNLPSSTWSSNTSTCSCK